MKCNVCTQPKLSHEMMEKKVPNARDLCISCFAMITVISIDEMRNGGTQQEITDRVTKRILERRMSA